jgi:hypothetical protein
MSALAEDVKFGNVLHEMQNAKVTLPGRNRDDFRGVDSAI